MFTDKYAKDLVLPGRPHTWVLSRSSVRHTDVLEAVAGSSARFLIQSRSAQKLLITRAFACDRVHAGTSANSCERTCRNAKIRRTSLHFQFSIPFDELLLYR